MDQPEERPSLTWKRGLLEIIYLIAIFAGLMVLYAVLSPPNFAGSRNSSPQNSCINNMRQIDGAINEWALEKGKTTNDMPTWDDIRPYIKLDAKGNLPKCPKGGTYTLYKVGTIPQVTCSLSDATPPHRLP